MVHFTESTPAEQARHVIARTVSAWRIAPVSAHAVARRAPYGHVPARALMRQIRAAASGNIGIAHSW